MLKFEIMKDPKDNCTFAVLITNGKTIAKLKYNNGKTSVEVQFLATENTEIPLNELTSILARVNQALLLIGG